MSKNLLDILNITKNYTITKKEYGIEIINRDKDLGAVIKSDGEVYYFINEHCDNVHNSVEIYREIAMYELEELRKIVLYLINEGVNNND